MHAIRELFTTPSGLLVLGVILFMVAMGAYIYFWVRKQIRKEPG